MKAAVYYETGAPDVFRYEDVPDPICQATGVVIDVRVISVEGGDTINRSGGQMPSRPHIVGYQCAGIVSEVGSNVADRHPGQPVVAIMPHGSHAEKVAVAAAQTWPVPEGLSLEEAACVPIAFGTAHDCLFEFGGLQAGETVLIQAGGGGVGLAAIQMAKRVGATVLATASSDDKLDRLKEFGLDHGINYAREDFVARARQITGGRGVDLVVDSVGGSTLRGSLKALAYRGRCISVGNAGRQAERSIDVGVLSEMNRTLTGVFFGAEAMMQPQRVRPLVQALLRDVASGQLRVVVDRTYPLAQAAQAHAYIESRRAFGRVLLIP